MQKLKAADREQFMRAFRASNPSLTYATIQLIRDCEPEEAVRHIMAQQHAAASGAAIAAIISMM